MPGATAGLLINGQSVNPQTDPRVDVIDDPALLGNTSLGTVFSVNNFSEFQCVIDNRTSMAIFLGRLALAASP